MRSLTRRHSRSLSWIARANGDWVNAQSVKDSSGCARRSVTVIKIHRRLPSPPRLGYAISSTSTRPPSECRSETRPIQSRCSARHRQDDGGRSDASNVAAGRPITSPAAYPSTRRAPALQSRTRPPPSTTAVAVSIAAPEASLPSGGMLLSPFVAARTAIVRSPPKSHRRSETIAPDGADAKAYGLGMSGSGVAHRTPDQSLPPPSHRRLDRPFTGLSSATRRAGRLPRGRAGPPGGGRGGQDFWQILRPARPGRAEGSDGSHQPL